MMQTTFIATLVPFFGDLMGLIGAIGGTPTTFVLPSVLWLVLKRPSKRSFEYWLNMFIIVSCSIIGFMGFISSVYFIVLHASTYGVFIR